MTVYVAFELSANVTVSRLAPPSLPTSCSRFSSGATGLASTTSPLLTSMAAIFGPFGSKVASPPTGTSSSPSLPTFASLSAGGSVFAG